MLGNLKNQDFALRHVRGLTVQVGMHQEGDKQNILCPTGVVNYNTYEFHLNSKINFPMGISYSKVSIPT